MAPQSRGPPRRHDNRRPRTHRPSESQGELLPRAHTRDGTRDGTRARDDRERHERRRASRHASGTHRFESSNESSDITKSGNSNPLSADSLARLNALNEKKGWSDYDNVQRRMRDAPDDEASVYNEKDVKIKVEKSRQKQTRRDGRDHNHYRDHDRKRSGRRVVSGPLLEEGRNHHRRSKHGHRGGAGSEDSESRAKRKKRRNWCIAITSIVLLIIIISVAVTVSKKKSDDSLQTPDDNVPKPSNANLASISPASIPASAKGTYYDPFSWYDTIDFNLTYTEQKVGGLPIMGLNSTWNDNTRANANVPPLTEQWDYGTRPIRGMNIGGWLSLEPFITPSFFDDFDSSDGVVDEWTLCQTLGAQRAAQQLEQHYSAFVSEGTLQEIQAAGFDHVRISFSYWAVGTYPGDPYVPQISWRYLLRAIEWARKYGLRVNLDMHGLPGSQNGWNHSGHQGPIGWLNGTDGDLNAQRSLDMHRQLSAFFAQPRYKNLVTMYGLVNEPRMVEINTESVLQWTQSAIDIVRGSGMSSNVIIVFGDGFMGLPNWQGKLTGNPNVLLDVHQYVIFNTEQIVLSHENKMDFACQGWTQQTEQSSDPSTGFGNFLCGEWSQADTDCAPDLNNVGVGSRWEGTMNTGNATTSVLQPTCPTANNPRCDCTNANADPSAYSPVYKKWLLEFAQAQMHSFEKGWGWFYWTWDTERSVQWSWKKGMAAGILPTSATDRGWDCQGSVPDYASLGLPEDY